jgi:tRNA A-37 threonylcarbamoyl transferase component Bud32/tetratricopeptide (TPR) repeat protein/TolB-like protein
MGTVYLALDRRHGRPVAIKVLPPDVAEALGPERFLREIGIVARLSHPNILPLYDSGRAGGRLYYVLPYIGGGSLADRLGQGPPIPVPEAVTLAREIADALAHAHAHGVIHRDVKPDNILLHEGHALLADFGVARAAGDGLRTDSDLAVGTAAYASPEQAAGSRGLDERSDVYGLGCVLYEMLAGPAPRGRELLARRFTEPLPPPTVLRGEVPSWLDGVVGQALAARPAQRYPTAAAFRDALATPSGAADTGPTLHPAPAHPAKGQPRRAPWMLAGAAALLVVAAAVAFLPGRLAHLDPTRLVVGGFENRTGDSTLAPIGDIAADYIARGLATTQLLQEVYDARAMAREAGQPARVGVAAGRDLARRVGAGTVLGGNYYREGDRLHFEAQVVDARTGRLILALQPVIGPLREQTRVIELLRQRVMAGFAVVFQPGFNDWKGAGVPPTYAAYQAMLIALDDLWTFKGAEAIPHLRRAIAEDSSYTSAKAQLAYALSGNGGCAEVDSIATAMDTGRTELAASDRGMVAYAQAVCRRDRPAMFAASKAMLQAAPHSIGSTVLGGIDAIELGRPREGLAILQRFDPDRIPLSDQQAFIYWGFLEYAEHDLAMIQQDSNGGRITAGSVLAPLADSAAVRRHIERQLQHPDPSELAGDQCAVLELRAHGSAAAAAALLERIAVARGPAAAAEVDVPPCYWNLYSPHYYAGRLEEARAAYEKRVEADTADVKSHAALATIAAREGDSTTLEAQRRWLTAHDAALAYLARARIAVIQGDYAQAVSLLRQALDRDLERHFLHLDPDLDPLRDYPPFRELMRFKG